MNEVDEYARAIYSILDAEEQYEEHKTRFGAINDKLRDALISVNKARKEKEKRDIQYKALVEDRDKYKKKLESYLTPSTSEIVAQWPQDAMWEERGEGE